METLGKTQKVEVWGDRPYYIVEYIDGKISFTMLRTSTLTEIIATLRQLNRMDKNAMLIACCYEQYKEIYKYGKNHYKTFMSKTIEANLGEDRTHMTKEEILMEKLNDITEKIRQVNVILSYDYTDRQYWTEKLNTLEKEQKTLQAQLK